MASGAQLCTSMMSYVPKQVARYKSAARAAILVYVQVYVRWFVNIVCYTWLTYSIACCGVLMVTLLFHQREETLGFPPPLGD